jgi:hypothetical protein
MVNTKTNTNLEVNLNTNLNTKASTEALSHHKTHTSHKLKAKKRSDSMLNYMNEFSRRKNNNHFSVETVEQNVEQINDQAPAKTTKPAAKAKKSKPEPKKATKPVVVKENPDVIVDTEENLNLIMEGWLRVSTPQLKNINRFPVITLPDKTQHQIPTQRDYFRVNESYDPMRNPNSAPSPFYFWMRLSFKNLYYSLSKDSINVVGNIPAGDIQAASVLKEYARSNKCFSVDDAQNKEWTLCAQSVKERNEWVCKIKALKKQDSETLCIKRLMNDEAIVIEKKVMQPIILIPQASPMCNENFTYEQNGNDWVCDCKEGI